MDFTRNSRFKRARVVVPVQLTNRDRDIISLVRRHRFLRSSQIAALLGSGSQQVLRRLQLLYHHGYLERPRAQLDYYYEGGSRPIVYGLGSKGAALLKQEPGTGLQRIRWNQKNRAVGRIFLEHALLVSDVMVAVELACRKSGQIRLLTESEIIEPTSLGSKCFQWKVSLPGQVKLGVIPDSVFGLEYSGRDGKLARQYFFLEADRGTMPVTRRHLTQTSFCRKLLAYEATWSQAIHRTRFGFPRFRVLTVATSVARVNSLLNACARLKRGHGLFLFGDRSQLANPECLFSVQWQTGSPGKMDTLLG